MERDVAGEELPDSPCFVYFDQASKSWKMSRPASEEADVPIIVEMTKLTARNVLR